MAYTLVPTAWVSTPFTVDTEDFTALPPKVPWAAMDLALSYQWVLEVEVE